MSLVSRRVFKVGGKSRLLPIGSRQIATSFDATLSFASHKRAAQLVRPIARRPHTPTALIETATVIAWGFASQPVKRAGKCAGIAEADLKCNCRDRPFAIRQ
jgi:hypothetical protein